MGELEYKLLHYKDTGPGLDWAQFLDDTAELSALKSLSEPDRFRLQLMRLALFRQQQRHAEGCALAEQMEECRHQARSTDLLVFDGEAVLLYLHTAQDQLMTTAALRLMHPATELDIWLQAYRHYVLCCLFTVLGNDTDAEREFGLARPVLHVEHDHPFGFIYNHCIYRLMECWMNSLRFPDQMPQLLEAAHALTREAQQYWPSYTVAYQSQNIHMIFQIIMGLPLSQHHLEDILEDLPEVDAILLKAVISYSAAVRYSKTGEIEKSNKEIERVIHLFKDHYRTLDKRTLSYYVEALLLLNQGQEERFPQTTIQLLELQARAFDWTRKRLSNGFTALIQQSRELADAQREKGNLLASLEAQRYELERAHRDLIARLAHVAEYRDDQTGGHAARVGRMTARLAKQLGYSTRHARDMGYAARLHDLGKVSLPDDILLKPGLLTAQEREEMQRHTRIGAQILSGATGALQTAHDIALYHHERWDGEGYPFGLKGEEIPFSARIVAVADVLDAMLTARPYRQPMSREEAIAEIRAMSGTHFDPKVVEALERVMVEMEQTLRW